MLSTCSRHAWCCLSILLLFLALLAPSPLPSIVQEQIAEFFGASAARRLDASEFRGSGLVSCESSLIRLGHRHCHFNRQHLSLGSFRCPNDEDAQWYFTTGTYRGAPGIEDRDNWAKLFQDYMGVPYTSEWETETWNYQFVYAQQVLDQTSNPSHYVMYHWHRYTGYTPAFGGNDEHLLFAAPLNGNNMTTKNPYTEWANMDAVVGMAPVWTNRWRSESSMGGGGPQFGCPSMETSFQLVSYRGRDLRAERYHWVLWREVMEDGIIYGSVRWIQVTDSCKNDYKTCPPFDPIQEGLFGTQDDPHYATRLFVKTSDSPHIKDYMQKPSLIFGDDGFIDEIGSYTDTKIFVHEYFNRTTFVRKFTGFGYTGHNHSAFETRASKISA